MICRYSDRMHYQCRFFQLPVLNRLGRNNEKIGPTIQNSTVSTFVGLMNFSEKYQRLELFSCR